MLIPWLIDSHVEPADQEKDRDMNAADAIKEPAPAPAAKSDVPEAGENAGEPDRSDSDDSDESVWLLR